VLFDTDAYRQNHLKHHGYLNSEADPDWVRKIQLPQWQFPLSLAYVARTYPKFLLWNGPREWFLIMMMLGGVLPIRDITKPDRRKKVAVRALYYGAVATGITAFSAWGLFLAYWVVPLVFVFPSLQRVRSVAEHFGLKRSHDLNSTRNVMAPWFERMLFGPHNIHYHLDHHLISSVPFYHLPRLHEILRENPTFRNLAHENTTYLLPSAKPLALDLFTQFSGEKQNGSGTSGSVDENQAA
jgi:fatty acid desaturase